MRSTTVLQPRRAFVGSSIRLYRALGFIGLSPGLGFIRLDQGLLGSVLAQVYLKAPFLISVSSSQSWY